jgi:hypothetical protein
MTTPLVDQKPTIAKAVVAAATSLGVGIATALADGQVTGWELALTILGAIVAGAGVWSTTNEPAKKILN